MTDPTGESGSYLSDLVRRKRIRDAGEKVLRICDQNPGIVKRIFGYDQFDIHRISINSPSETDHQVFHGLADDMCEFLREHGVKMDSYKYDPRFAYWEANVKSPEEQKRAVELMERLVKQRDFGIGTNEIKH